MWLQENLSSASVSLSSCKPSEPIRATRMAVCYGYQDGKIVMGKNIPPSRNARKNSMAKGPILHTPLPLTTPPHSGSGKAVLCDQKQGKRTLVKKGVRADW